MSLPSKLRTALSIWKNQGPRAVVRALGQRLGLWEEPFRPDESRLAFEALGAGERPGVMVDVGAHFGGALAPFARAGWRVLGLEPDSENRARLRETFGACPNVTIDPRAVSDRAEEAVTLYRSPESTGVSGLSAFLPSHAPGEQVRVTTLERLFEEHRIAEVDFLKVDTEGFDLFVLRGAPWDRVAPRLVLCEFEDAKSVPLGYSFHDLAGFLRERGYGLLVSEWFPIRRYGGPHDWRRFVPYPCELEDRRAWGNIIAAREPDLYDAMLEACSRAAGAGRVSPARTGG